MQKVVNLERYMLSVGDLPVTLRPTVGHQNAAIYETREGTEGFHFASNHCPLSLMHALRYRLWRKHGNTLIQHKPHV